MTRARLHRSMILSAEFAGGRGLLNTHSLTSEATHRPSINSQEYTTVESRVGARRHNFQIERVGDDRGKIDISGSQHSKAEREGYVRSEISEGIIRSFHFQYSALSETVIKTVS